MVCHLLAKVFVGLREVPSGRFVVGGYTIYPRRTSWISLTVLVLKGWGGDKEGVQIDGALVGHRMVLWHGGSPPRRTGDAMTHFIGLKQMGVLLGLWEGLRCKGLSKAWGVASVWAMSGFGACVRFSP